MVAQKCRHASQSLLPALAGIHWVQARIMSGQPSPFLTPEQYLEIERDAQFRSECVAGEMFAMSGGSLNHARIAANTLRRILERLDGSPCGAAGSDLRVFCARGRMFTYPDVVVFCGPPKFLDQRRDVITDATAIVEVLSPLPAQLRSR